MEFEEFLTHYQLRLDAQQLAAVQAADVPVLLLAVPGSGKTTVLLARLGYLLYCKGVNPRSILTTTYTVAATNELRTRFARQFGEKDAAQLEFRTLNGVCARIIRAYEQQGHTAFELVTDERLTALLGELWREAHEEYATEADLRAVRTGITRLKNSMADKKALAELETGSGTEAKQKLVPIYRAYNKALRARRWMDYDDQMVYALAILRRSPALLQRLQNYYRYFCVDEAQDTSKIQHEILRLLAGKSRSLFMVGDEDQSIYGFRAACPEALVNFEQTWPGAKILYLEQNYRSTPQIVKTARRFIAQNVSRYPKSMRTPNPDGAEVLKLTVANRVQQYQALADLAAKANAQRQETAVLYRDNDTALPIIDLLTRRGIPYRAKGVDSLFFSSRILRDVTDFLHFAAEPCNGEVFMRIYYKLGAAISKPMAEQAVRLSQYNGAPILSCISGMDNISRRMLEKLKEVKSQLGLLPEDTAERAVSRIVEDLGYGVYLDEHYADRTRLDILQTLAAEEPTPQALLRRLAELQQIIREGGNAQDSYFLLSTIHSSKGLEYDHVILADVIDGQLPQDACYGTIPDPAQLAALEEDRRIFYVGMTRARKTLRLVTFQGDWRLHSSFADVLFPPPKSASQHVPLSRGFTLAQAAGSTAPNDTEAYQPGVRIRHTVYGGGMISHRRGDKAEIVFDSGAKKTLSLPSALSCRALELE